MEEQDRSRWDAALIEERHWHLRRAVRSGRPPGALPIAGTDRCLPCHGGSCGGHRLGHNRHPLRRPARRPAVTRDRLEPGYSRRLPRRLRGWPNGSGRSGCDSPCRLPPAAIGPCRLPTPPRPQRRGAAPTWRRSTSRPLASPSSGCCNGASPSSRSRSGLPGEDIHHVDRWDGIATLRVAPAR
ncbi:MAG: hypothetical protein ACRDWI_16470 [Jiangellaceae bacterium]